MLSRLTSVPFFVLLMGAGALAMLLPAIYAFAVGQSDIANTFVTGSVLGLGLTLFVGLATFGYAPKNIARSQLISIVAAYSALPLILAVPFHQGVGDTSFLNAWFEMVSSFTTTGATIYDTAGRLAEPLHLWRAIVGWLGGFLIWVTAVAIFAPMNLGGFEVLGSTAPGEGSRSLSQIARVDDPAERLAKYAWRLLPVYSGLTMMLWIGLVVFGEDPFVAACHAMSILSTSGISPLSGLHEAQSGVAGEVVMALFLVFALSRLTFGRGVMGQAEAAAITDPEFRLGLILILAIPILLFGRHFGLQEGGIVETQWAPAIAALWGALFTTASFVTTTGFESAYWLDAADWAGLRTPGLILLALALVGGGVATTAGGVKLLRIYALYKHSRRELDRLIHPSSVGGAGSTARHIRRHGAQIAWIFFMLFALSLALVMVTLSLTGVQFETAMVLAVSTLSTTGPLAQVAAESPISYAGVPDIGKMILAAAMVLGRLETLAIIALLNPEFWRS